MDQGSLIYSHYGGWVILVCREIIVLFLKLFHGNIFLWYLLKTSTFDFIDLFIIFLNHLLKLSSKPVSLFLSRFDFCPIIYVNVNSSSFVFSYFFTRIEFPKYLVVVQLVICIISLESSSSQFLGGYNNLWLGLKGLHYLL